MTKQRIPLGALIATLVGNTLEFYDFLIYSFFAIYIGNAFFPTESELASLLLSVATFGIGFLTRPLGGIWIGAYADRRGRKPALLLTIVLMAIGTLAIVVTPSYATIGPAAPIILVLARLVQGIAVGGEVGPVTAVLIEGAPEGKRALFTSLSSVSQGVAILFGGVVGYALANTLDTDELASWGWRAGFAVGLSIVPVGFYLRRSLPETLPEGKHESATATLRAVWSGHKRELVLVVIVTSCATISTYVAQYMAVYAQNTLGMPPSAAMVAPLAMGGVFIVGALVGGVVSDRFGRKRTMIVSRAGVMVLQLPAFLYLEHERTITALVLSIVVVGMVAAPGSIAALTAMAEVFPTEVRAAGISLAYALTVTIFGGTTQFAIAWLIGVTEDPLAPAYYVIVSSAISIGAMMMLGETSGRSK
jgi:MFS family permease